MFQSKYEHYNICITCRNIVMISSYIASVYNCFQYPTANFICHVNLLLIKSLVQTFAIQFQLLSSVFEYKIFAAITVKPNKSIYMTFCCCYCTIWFDKCVRERIVCVWIRFTMETDRVDYSACKVERSKQYFHFSVYCVRDTSTFV